MNPNNMNIPLIAIKIILFVLIIIHTPIATTISPTSVNAIEDVVGLVYLDGVFVSGSVESTNLPERTDAIDKTEVNAITMIAR